METITAKNFNQAYPELIERAMAVGQEVPSRLGPTFELHPAVIEVAEPREHLVTSIGRPVNVAFALAEVIWILTGSREVAMLEAYNSRISQYSDDGNQFNAAYGYRLRKSHGHDQLDDVIKVLRADRGSRQAMLTMWHPDDRGFVPMPSHNGGVGDVLDEPNVTADRACNVMAHPMIRRAEQSVDALDWLQVVRSNDAVWGVPYNWMQWSHIQEYIAHNVGVPVGKYVHVADSMHVYKYHWDEAKLIQPFSLYEALGGYTHTPMGPMTEYNLKQLKLAELWCRQVPLNRIEDETMALAAVLGHSVGPYWHAILYILLAHRYYREGLDHTCYSVLLECPDPVYRYAAMSFYYKMRWSKQETSWNAIIRSQCDPRATDYVLS